MLLSLVEGLTAFAAISLLLPLRAPCCHPAPTAQPRLSPLHRLTSSRHEINIPRICSALGRLCLLSETPLPLAVSLVSTPCRPVSAATLSREPSWVSSHSTPSVPPQFRLTQLMSPPGRDWVFLIPCPISGCSCNAFPAQIWAMGDWTLAVVSTGCGSEGGMCLRSEAGGKSSRDHWPAFASSGAQGSERQG